MFNHKNVRFFNRFSIKSQRIFSPIIVIGEKRKEVIEMNKFIKHGVYPYRYKNQDKQEDFEYDVYQVERNAYEYRFVDSRIKAFVSNDSDDTTIGIKIYQALEFRMPKK